MDRITFISVEDKDVEFEKELILSCKAFTEEACGEGLVTEATEKTLQIFKQFLEIHKYEPKNASIEVPIQSDNLKEHVDENSYKIIKDLDIEDLKNLLDLAEMFDCDMLRGVCLVAVQCQFFIADKKKFIEKFKQENGIDEDFTEEEENEIINESMTVLKEIMATYDTSNPDYKPKQLGEDEEEEDEEKLIQNLQDQLEQKGNINDNDEEEKNN